MIQPENSSEYLRIAEAARFLGVTQRWVYNRIAAGELPASKVGGLYFIARADLQALLEANRGAGKSPEAAESVPVAVQKCGHCFRVLTSDTQIAGVCKQEGCSELICLSCAGQEIQHCARHFPSREERWQAALQQYQQGSLPRPIRAVHARLAEVNFLNRIQLRLQRFTSLIHPLSGEALNIPKWEACLQQGDERAELMSLLGKVMLQAEELAQYPLNAWLRYSLPPNRRSSGLEINVRALSRLPVMLRDGFDAQPLGFADLAPWVHKAGEPARGASPYRIFLLCSPTGWDAEARAAVSGDPASGQVGLAIHSSLLYLFDQPEGRLVYHTMEENARRYAEMFSPALPEEELGEAMRAVENELLVYESLTLEFASQVLPFPPALIKRAFEELAKTHPFSLAQIKGLGLAIIRRSGGQ